VGEFAGAGQWFDAAGKTGTYTVVQSIRPIDDGLEIAFHHDFDDGNVTDATLTLKQVVERIYLVAIAGHPVGHAAWHGDTLHYHLEVAQKFVEVGYRAVGDELVVFGSSTKNLEGNYIAWTERLQRALPG